LTISLVKILPPPKLFFLSLFSLYIPWRILKSHFGILVSPCVRTFQGLHSVRLWTPTIFILQPSEVSVIAGTNLRYNPNGRDPNAQVFEVVDIVTHGQVEILL
jgi:hypothetical protein